MKWGVVGASQLGDNWSAEHHLARQEGTQMTEGEELLGDVIDRLQDRYAVLRHAAMKVIRTYGGSSVLYQDPELDQAIQDLRALINPPSTTREGK